MNSHFGFFVKIFVVVVVVFLLGFYFFHQTKAYFGGPGLVVEKPQDGEVFSSSLAKVKGRATNTSEINLNGRRILSDSNGNFEENLLLAKGYNIIEMTIKDKFGKVLTKTIRVVLK